MLHKSANIITGLPKINLIKLVRQTFCIPKFKREMSIDDEFNESLVTLNKKKIPLTLVSKTTINHDTRLFRFALPTKNHYLGLPIGNCVLAFAQYTNEENEEKSFHRAYTPVSSNRDKGFMDLIVKIYFPDTNPDHPNGGKMTMMFENLKIGESLEFWGPGGYIQHHIHENGVDMTYHQNKKRIEENLVQRKGINRIGMIAGGTGIAPMLQLLREIFSNKIEVVNKTTKVTLIFLNKTKDDILCREELDQLVGKSESRFKIVYSLTKDNWEDEKDSENDHKNIKKVTGRVDKKMIEENLPHYSEENSSILLCGRPAMVKETCQPILEEIGWDMRNVYSY